MCNSIAQGAQMDPYSMIAEMMVPILAAVRGPGGSRVSSVNTADVADYLRGDRRQCPVCVALSAVSEIRDCPACMMKESGV